MQALGMRSLLASAVSQRKPVALLKQEKSRKKRRMQVRHLTNTHLKEVFASAEAAQYTSIDRT